MVHEQLKLENQLCFPIYAASRMISREYQPYLNKLNITYPQYLVLLVLWEQDGVTVSHLSRKLFLNSNTLTPLLKRMEDRGLIIRQRSLIDERNVLIHLTEEGHEMEHNAAHIPHCIASRLMERDQFDIDELTKLKSKLEGVISVLSSR